MNKFNYAEHIKLGRDSRKDWEQKLLDEQTAKQQPVLSAIKDLETEKKNLEHVCQTQFLERVELFENDLNNMDTRGLFQCITHDLGRLKSWYSAIVYEVSSTASNFSATIHIEKSQSEKVFDKVKVEVKYDPLCSDAWKDAQVFQDQIANANFTGLKENLNTIISECLTSASIISTQANALINKIKRDQTKDRRQIMSYLISELSTNGLKRPSGGRGMRNYRRFIVTERQNGEDGYYIPWHIKLLDKWRFDGEPSWDDTTELECEVTFRKTLYDMDYNDVGYQTQSGKVKIDAYRLYKWVKDLFIYQLRPYETSRDYGNDYYNRAIEELNRTPYLDTSTPHEEGHYSLYQNKKDRALRDSFGEWVKVPNKGLKIDEAGKITKVVEA